MRAAQKQDYMVLVYGNADFDKIPNTLVDGMVLPDEYIASAYIKNVGKHYRLPAVVMSYGGQMNFERSLPVVECDMWEGMNMILHYLFERGHSKIACLTTRDIGRESARIIAWKEMMKEVFGKDGLEKYFLGISSKGLEGDERVKDFIEVDADCENAITVQEPFFEKGMLGADIFKERRLDATAVVCFNDEMALGFYKRASQIGIDIPGRVSLVGIDGIYSRRYVQRKLTSLDISPIVQGERCVEVLLDIIEGKRVKYITRVPLRIDEGETVEDIR